MTLFYSYIVAMNVVTFTLMGLDKSYAKRGERRIAERTLLLLAALGGSAGAYLAMKLFRHKTRQTAFAAGLPALVAVNLIIVWFLTK